eukprot:scaffold574_cov190-Amphora_coffeaeformis.AAC.23
MILNTAHVVAFLVARGSLIWSRVKYKFIIIKGDPVDLFCESTRDRAVPSSSRGNSPENRLKSPASHQ